ncbi:MAG: D-alanine--D-alanine ligase [Actinomycetota bacterium]|nr:D-alanine--D-alanine ligase [Actinomycetota bacterium]
MTPRPGSRIRVAVVYGGRSSEHAISCVSAGSILRHLDPSRFDVVPVGIARDGSWLRADADPEELVIADGRLPEVVGGSENPLSRVGEVLADIDVVFPILHGPYGEDGTVQGLLELAGLPYVGAGVFASAAGMDKEFTKKILAAAGLPIGDFTVLRPHQSAPTASDIERLGFPLFVKPARGGSSIGVSRVTGPDDVPGAIAEARRHDPKVIIEAAIIGRELECGVLEFPDGSVNASTIGEIRVPGVGVYDFETKYLDDAAELDVPAALPDTDAKLLQDLAIRTFDALDCQGLARVDFFLTEDGPVINEINTMPGFTTISMYPRMWAASGVDYPTLVGTMVETALARGTGLR